MKKAYLEYREGNSSKFWSASVEDSDLVIVYGKIGTDGREVRKPQASSEAAEAQLEKEANKKRKKGYLDASAGEASPEDDWEQLRRLQQFANTFSGVEGPRVRVQLIDTRDALAVEGASRIGGNAPVGVEWPTSDRFSSFEGIDAQPDDERQTHLMTLELDKLDVAAVPEGAALSFFTPFRQWLPMADPISVAIAPTGADLSPAESGPDQVGDWDRAPEARGVRISPAVEVPALVFWVSAGEDFDEYTEMYEEETEELADADKDEREDILADGEFAGVFQWAGKRIKLTRAQFEAIDGIQGVLKESVYVGGAPLYIQQEPNPDVEIDQFHIQFGEELGVNAGDCGLVYVGLQGSSWDCN